MYVLVNYIIICNYSISISINQKNKIFIIIGSLFFYIFTIQFILNLDCTYLLIMISTSRIIDYVFVLYCSSHLLVTIFLDSQMLSLEYHPEIVSF